jgi:hypothetical protein
MQGYLISLHLGFCSSSSREAKLCAKRRRGQSGERKNGGAYRNRTDDILLAKQALSQLS